MLRAMALGDWVRRLFSPAPAAASAEDEIILREEYGGEGGSESAPGGAVAGGPTELAGLEDAEAAEDAVDKT
jgi:hypothetical protein